MKIFNWNDLSLEFFSKPSALTIGVFDGIHIGHAELLNKVLSAKEKGFFSGVVTFSDSIFDMFKSGEVPLQTLKERFLSLENMGFDFIILIDFTPQIAALSGTEFLDILRTKCNLSYLVEGEDFCFGAGGKTGMNEISEYCEKNKIKVSFVPPVLYEGKRVSSSMIRALLKDGEVNKARNLMIWQNI
ncbi:MAG: FAD synthetase family protein [Treponema sp.]|nr:FAD synthetase family protein [Treponema sp.]